MLLIFTLQSSLYTNDNTVKPLTIILKGPQKINGENDSCRKVIYMGDVQRPEKVNDICVKTMHV
jgi:hypothetical protein